RTTGPFRAVATHGIPPEVGRLQPGGSSQHRMPDAVTYEFGGSGRSIDELRRTGKGRPGPRAPPILPGIARRRPRGSRAVREPVRPAGVEGRPGPASLGRHGDGRIDGSPLHGARAP